MGRLQFTELQILTSRCLVVRGSCPIFAECRLVLPEAQAPQPDHDVHDESQALSRNISSLERPEEVGRADRPGRVERGWDSGSEQFSAINSKGAHGGWVQKLECTAWAVARPRCVFRVEAYLGVLGEQEAECSCSLQGKKCGRSRLLLPSKRRGAARSLLFFGGRRDKITSCETGGLI
jgi:hypothetical protein